jgi:hypothetical protein
LLLLLASSDGATVRRVVIAAMKDAAGPVVALLASLIAALAYRRAGHALDVSKLALERGTGIRPIPTGPKGVPRIDVDLAAGTCTTWLSNGGGGPMRIRGGRIVSTLHVPLIRALKQAPLRDVGVAVGRWRVPVLRYTVQDAATFTVDPTADVAADNQDEREVTLGYDALAQTLAAFRRPGRWDVVLQLDLEALKTGVLVTYSFPLRYLNMAKAWTFDGPPQIAKLD